MPGDYFWQCVESLATTFDGSPQDVEEKLELYVHKCAGFSPDKRAEVRRNMIKIIGGLAQIETRVSEMEVEKLSSAKS